MPGAPLRSRLFLLAAAAILPLAFMAAAGLRALGRQQRAQAQSAGLELARSVAKPVDPGELTAIVASVVGRG